MKLLITLDFPPEHGGIQRHLAGIVAHTFTKEDAVFVGCRRALTGEPQVFPCAVTYLSTPLSRLNKKWSLVPLFVRSMTTRRRRGESLAIECGNVYAGLVAWLMSLILPVRYLVYAHGTELTGIKKTALSGMLLKSVLQRADRIVANSAYTASLVRGLCPADPPVDIIFPKMDLVPAKASLSNTRAAEHAGETAILCVGRLVPHKGHSVLLEAVSRLPHTMQWSLVIAGDGPLLGPLVTRCRTLALTGRVRFKTGLSDTELEREYREASLFVLPSVLLRGTEGFGIVLLEAMAHQLPIIATNTGGVAEVLDNGSCGVLVPPSDVSALCDSIRLVASDRPLRERLVSAALERLRTRYAWR
jgi:glycosyltransferase involved in cell wall biosynthesis